MTELEALAAEMARLLDLIDAEWRSDPTPLRIPSAAALGRVA
jgi:hypothetical protein